MYCEHVATPMSESVLYTGLRSFYSIRHVIHLKLDQRAIEHAAIEGVY